MDKGSFLDIVAGDETEHGGSKGTLKQKKIAFIVSKFMNKSSIALIYSSFIKGFSRK